MPLYLCGARMSYFSAIMPIADGLGLSVAVTSYDGRIIVSPTSCRELMPDPEFFAQCVRDSFQELLAAAQGVPVASQKARRRASVTAKPAAAADRTPAPKAARTAPRRASARTAGPAR
jgi:hypothetical protein